MKAVKITEPFKIGIEDKEKPVAKKEKLCLKSNTAEYAERMLLPIRATSLSPLIPEFRATNSAPR